MPSPLVVDIKRHSLEDGPGIRSVVFFKGCPLRCVFCQNPEAQNPEPETVFRPRGCVGCNACVAACPHGALAQGPAHLDRALCTGCGACAAVCPAGALTLIGRSMSVDEVVEVVLHDEPYYRHSGGGVTLSGGECTAFPEFAGELLARLQRAHIHTAIETCGEFSFLGFARHILPHVDLILYDLKLADSDEHRRYTGRGNDRIWSNLAALLRIVPARVQPRIPLVPGITATRDNLAALTARLQKLGALGFTLLPYNPLGAAMAEALGRPYPPCVPRSLASGAEVEATVTWLRSTAPLRRQPLPHA